MAQEVSPAFQFYVKEWRSSRAIQRMTFAQRGMYLEMLLEQWENFSLPDNPAAVAELIGGTVDEWTASWPVLRRKFVERHARPRPDQSPDDPELRRIANVKLEAVRRAMRRYRSTARKGGLARAKSAKRGNDGTYSPAGAPAAIQQRSSTPTPTPTPTPSATPTPTATAEEQHPREAREDARFTRFWAVYPKKVAKGAALKAWRKRQPDDALVAEMFVALEWQTQSEGWQKDGGQYVPNPATWLNGGRWEDERPAAVLQFSDTLRYNLAASDEAERLILDNETRRTGTTHGHRR